MLDVWNAVCNKNKILISYPDKLFRTEISALISYPDKISLFRTEIRALISYPDKLISYRNKGPYFVPR